MNLILDGSALSLHSGDLMKIMPNSLSSSKLPRRVQEEAVLPKLRLAQSRQD